MKQFLLESLRLLYWAIFKPITLERHVRSLAPNLPPDASLLQKQARRELRTNVPLRRFLIQAFYALIIASIALSLMAELIRSVPGGAAFDWLRVAFGVAVGVATGVAAGVATGVATGVVAGVAGGVAGGVAVGVAAGVALGVMWGVVFSMEAGVAGGVAAGVALGVMWSVAGGVIAGMAFGVAGGVAAGVIFIPCYFRVPFYLLELPWAVFILFLSRLNPLRAPSYLHLSPIYFDEVIWLPLPFLDRHLVLIAEQDREAGLEEIAYVARSFCQGWAAQAALLELAARDLEAASSLPQMAQAEKVLAWLPKEPEALPRGAYEAFQGIWEVTLTSGSVMASTSRYRKVMELEKARARLDDLRKSIAFTRGGVAARLGPAVEGWRDVISAELARLTAEEEVEEIPQVYIAGPPVPGEEKRLFVGREDLFRTIEDILSSPFRKPTLMLHGQRRTGKTSLLLQLPRRLGPDVVPAFVNMQRAANVEGVSGLLYNLARAVAEEAHRSRGLRLPSLAQQDLAVEPFIAFDEWLNEAEKALGERVALLSLDEFEKIEERIERIGTESLDFLRDLIEHRPRLVLLFSGSHTLEEMGRRWSTYFINVQPLKVSYLKEADARQLITNPIDDFPLNYEEEAVERIIAATRCQPFLVQLTCQELVNFLNSQRRRFAQVKDVEAALEEALVRGEFHFVEIWNTADPLEREVLTAIAKREDGPLTFQDLWRETGREEVQLRGALERLCRRDLLEHEDEGYRFQVELVQEWWRRR